MGKRILILLGHPSRHSFKAKGRPRWGAEASLSALWPPPARGGLKHRALTRQWLRYERIVPALPSTATA